MQMCGVFQALGREVFDQLIRGISIGKLKTYQVYERFNLRSEPYWFPVTPRKAALQARALRLLGAHDWRRRLGLGGLNRQPLMAVERATTTDRRHKRGAQPSR